MKEETCNCAQLLRFTLHWSFMKKTSIKLELPANNATIGQTEYIRVDTVFAMELGMGVCD